MKRRYYSRVGNEPQPYHYLWRRQGKGKVATDETEEQAEEMPKRYRGPVSRPIISGHTEPSAQTRTTSQSAAKRPRAAAALSARRSKLEHYLDVEQDSTKASSAEDTADSYSEAESDDGADQRVTVDDVTDPARLRTYLADALDVINKGGCHAPESLKPLLASRLGVAYHRSLALTKRIQQEYSAITVNIHTGTDISADDLNDSLKKFLPEVQEIVQLRGGPSVSYRLLTDLRKISFNLLNQLSNPVPQSRTWERTADDAYDKLLAEYFRKDQAEGHSTWHYVEDLKLLNCQRMYLEKAGLDDWYSETHMVLKEIVSESV